MAQNLADLFEHAVDAVPDRIAVVDGGVGAGAGAEFTYRELDERANRLAHLLIEHGVARGGHVAIHMHNAVDTLAGFLASFKIRAVPVNINYRYVHDELAYVYGDADVVAVLTQPRYADAARGATERPVIIADDGFVDVLAGHSPDRDFEARADDDLFLMYTGGTTGAPKGVMWRQCDMWRVLGGGIDFYSGELMADEFAQSSRAAKSADPMRFLMLPPLIHVSGLMPTLGALFSGNTVVFEPRFDAARVWEVVEARRPAIMVITGDAMGRPLIDELESRAADGRAVDVSSLLAVSSGAALFSPALKARLLGLIPTVAISDSIGSSETGFGGIRVYSAADTSFSTADHAGGPRVPAGRGATVIDDDGRPLNEPGDGWFAKTGYLPIGYYNDEVKSATIFREYDGVRMVVSGDRARLESDGAITLLGRGSQVVNTGGEKVFVEEVEGELKSHPTVVDAIVIGTPDERFGQRVAAVIAISGVPDFAAIDAHLRTRLAGYKVPRSYWVVDAVARTPSGKPDYAWAKSTATESDPTHVRDSARADV